MKTPVNALFFLFFSFSAIFAQQTPQTPAAARIAGFAQRKVLESASLVNGVEFRSIGPSVFGGRIVDLDVWEKDPTHFYVAYASGGLWKTNSNGQSFEPLFEKEMVMTIGDIAVDWNNNHIWVGSGEVNSSRSSYSGNGVFRSTDGGKSWKHLGLGESHHIGRILLHPKDPNTAWVAVLGHLYTDNDERGVFKTSDGGKTWQKVLFINDKTGVVDLLMDPANPNVLYAAAWQRSRKAWDFTESGEGSGIYKSTDGGKSWRKLTTPTAGIPTGEGLGRIGLTMTRANGKPVLYAAIDNYARRPAEKSDDPELVTKEQVRNMSAQDFLQLKKYQIKEFLVANGFPQEYSADKVMAMVKEGKVSPTGLVEYTEDANSLLFDTPVVGLEVYRSDDEGATWKKTHNGYLDNVYSSYGYYFGTIRVAPYDANQIFVLGVPVIRSDDGGKTFKSVDQDNVHSDHHALWINPKRPGHLLLGNDGGLNISYDNGKNYNVCNTPPVGQFYYVAVDMAQPYNVYGGLQDNGVWMGPSTYSAGSRWQSSGQYPYRSIFGGDGMQVAIDSRDNATVYTGLQFGFYARLNIKTGERRPITPRHKLGERPLRWNWQTPIHLSSHNQDILYMGSNKVHRSLNKGNDFTAISGDLTKGGIKGDVPFGTLTTLHESPLKFGLLYAGSDDGLIHLTRDGGTSWERISDALPKDLWVARVQASAFEEGRAYACLNGYRSDDFTAYLFVTEDFGKSWSRIGSDLPMEPLNVVKEDPSNADILYVGSDHGMYVSLDRGKSFMLMNNGLPAVPVHDLVVHPREKEILVGTHGRSLYLGRAKELQQLNAQMLGKTVHAFDPDPLNYSPRWGNAGALWDEATLPVAKLPVFVATAGAVSFSIQTEKGEELFSFVQQCEKGLNYVPYSLEIAPAKASAIESAVNARLKDDDRPLKMKPADNGKMYLYRGTYTVVATKDGAQGKAALKLN
ncbi:MAG: WD40/YVTN/BNR-like repeat-containing protein [Saprospiraceae bacterium]